MLTDLEKFAVMLRWKDSHGRGSTMRIADELRLPRKDVLDYVVQELDGRRIIWRESNG
jgi:hypothetical protein